MAVTRNFRLKSVTSRNTRTCAIRTTILIRGLLKIDGA
jgi:hypothetical protein